MKNDKLEEENKELKVKYSEQVVMNCKHLQTIETTKSQNSSLYINQNLRFFAEEKDDNLAAWINNAVSKQISKELKAMQEKSNKELKALQEKSDKELKALQAKNEELEKKYDRVC